MASEVGICNRALQILGAKRITSLTEDSRNARACNVAYEPVRDAELRDHDWAFAIKREQLAASSTTPAFGRARAFPLPPDFVRLLGPYPEDNLNDRDWIIEAREILSDDSAPLNVRYIAQITDPNVMDAAFREALAAKLAVQMCEEITQSNSKVQTAMELYRMAVRTAKRANAIESVPLSAPEDSWITARL